MTSGELILRVLVVELRDHLSLMVSYLHDEVSEGDGLREEHSCGYAAAKTLLERTARIDELLESSLIEWQEIRESAERARESVALLRRICKYAHEDRMQTPGVTRLARAIDEARTLLDSAGEVRL